MSGTSAPAAAPAAFDPLCARTRSDPYPVLAGLRQHDPVHWCEPLRAWLLTRHADVRRLARDPAFSAARLEPFFARLDDGQRQRMAAVIRYLTAWMVFRDPPQHTRLRALAGRAFTPRHIAPLAARIESLVAQLSRPLADAGEGDLIEALAGPLPALVIMHLLGVPAADVHDLKRWSDELALFVGSSQASAAKYARAEAGAHALADYFRPLLRARRRAPRADLLSAMLERADSDGYSDDEVVACAVLLLFAGHETTTHLIANAVHAMVQGPAWGQLAQRPELASQAVEEALRYDGPVTSLPRVMARQLRLRGRDLLPGQRVFGMVLAANRDPARFDQPDRFDMLRTDRGHIGFGHGVHTCLGAPLARLEGRLVLASLARRHPRLRLAGTPDWQDSLVFRAMHALPLAGF